MSRPSIRRPLLLCLLPLAACAPTAPHQSGAAAPQAHAVAAAGTSQAGQAKKPVSVGHGNNVDVYIQVMDLNQDGAVTPDEVEKQRRQHFATVDRNGDGGIDMQEYVDEFRQRMQGRIQDEMGEINRMTDVRFESLSGKQSHISRSRYDQAGERAFSAYAQGKLPAALPRQPGQRRSALQMPTNHTKEGMLALYDRNLDGQLTREEFDLVRDEQFKRTDINRDGRLSRAEYATEFQQRVDARLHEMMTREMRQARVRFGVLDDNKDDRIDADEYVRTGQQMFKRVDRNQDGKVTAADAAPPKSKDAKNKDVKAPQGQPKRP